MKDKLNIGNELGENADETPEDDLTSLADDDSEADDGVDLGETADKPDEY